MTDQADEHVRRAIRDAMDRLIDGKALHSDGKLTIKALAEAARVKRWLLTHRHTDLQHKFRARIANTNVEPPVVRALQVEMPSRQAAADEEAADNAAILERNAKAKLRWHNRNFLNKWWQHSYRRADMLEAISPLPRYIGTARLGTEKRMSVFQFIDPAIRPDDEMTVIALDDDYSLGVVSSKLHRAWLDERCSKLEARPRYSSTTVWDSFPWRAFPSESAVAQVANAMGTITEYRAGRLAEGITLGQQYDALRMPGKSELRDMHGRLDAAVVELTDSTRRRTCSPNCWR